MLAISRAPGQKRHCLLIVANLPAGGSLFLFDRKAVRFFRRDNHNWRKKADGKTVRETHEKLKVGHALLPEQRPVCSLYATHDRSINPAAEQPRWLAHHPPHSLPKHAALSMPASSSSTGCTEACALFC